MDIKQIIAQRLKQCRREQDWTVEDVASRIQIIPSRYYNWEQALRAPKPEQIFKLADLYKKSAAWIAGYTDDEGTPASTTNFISVSHSMIPVKDALMTLETISNDSALSRDYIRRRQLEPNMLTQVVAPDNSMCGTKELIKEGDELLIDRTQIKVIKADIFALIVNNQLWIRWIRPELNGTYTIAAEDSSHYPDHNISEEELQKQKIIGRISRVCRDR